MGRGRSAIKQAFDLKQALFTLLDTTIGDIPVLCRAAGFFPRYGTPAPARVRVLDESLHHPPMFGPDFAQERLICETANVDDGQTSSWTDVRSVRRFVAIVEDVIIPGHRVTPVDPATGRQIAFDRQGRARWSTARPAPVMLNRHVVSEGLTLSLPPARHYGHLLTDFILPYYFALSRIGFDLGRKLTVVTPQNPAPLTRAFVESLTTLGYAVDPIETGITETVQAARYLHARCQTTNREREFAVPEAIDLARTALLGALAAQPALPAPARLYLSRGDRRIRQVENEDLLVEALRHHGFTIFEAGWGNIRQQIEWFGQADIVAGVHGAGLVNMLWAKPGALLIEVQARNARKTTGLHWASEAGARYHTVLGGDEGLRQNFAIDPDAVLAEILAAVATHEANDTLPRADALGHV